jgi:hypothetical protein
MSHTDEVLSRTVLLVRRDLYPSLSEQQIAEHLASRRIRLRADARNLTDPAGQAAAVAFTLAATQSGARLFIDLPDVPLAGSQPPLAPTARLADGLRGLCSRLIAPPLPTPEGSELEVLLGDTPASGETTPTIRLAGGAFEGQLHVDPAHRANPWQGEICFGAQLAALAGAAECFREAMLTLALASGTPPLAEHRIGPVRPARLVLPPLPLTQPLDLRVLDIISAGAITNGALLALLRIPGLRGQIRVLDADTIELSNLNRYALADRSMIGQQKVSVLARLSRGRLHIRPCPVRLTDTAPAGQLAPRVLVGVDDIPSRWVAQRRCGGWLCVGASSRMEILISEHSPGQPCGGCMHPYNDNGEDAIPTVAFVSQLAGLLQAHRLLAHTLGHSPQPALLAYGLALDSPRALLAIGQSPHPDCPVRCELSVAARAA